MANNKDLTEKKRRTTSLSRANLTEKFGADKAEEMIKSRISKTTATRRKNVEVTERLSNMLLEANSRNGKSYLEEWFTVFLKEAKSKPNSRASSFIAESVGLNKDFFDKADKWLQQAQEKDKDFEMWRLMKNLTPTQQASWPAKGQHQLLNASGRGWGKTVMNAALLLYYASFKCEPTLYLNKTHSSAMGQIWQPLLDLMDACAIKPTKIDKSTGYIEFTKNGIGTGSIRLGGHDNKSASDSYRGWEFALAILDEGFYHKGNIKYLIEDILEPRMGKFNDHLMVVSCSPPRSHKSYFEHMRETWPTISYNMRDNPHMSNSWALFDEKKRLNTNTIRREWLGIWEIDTESVIWNRNKEYTEPEHTDYIVIGVDYGYNDPTAVVLLAGDKKSKRIWEIESVSQSHLIVSQQIDLIKSFHEKAKVLADKRSIPHKNIFIVTDTDEKSISRELSVVHDLPVQTAWKVDKINQIRKMDDWLRCGRLFVRTEGPVAEDMDASVWKRDDDDNIIDQIDEDVHHANAAHALRYALGHL